MATMNISLPEQMKAWVEAQSESGRFSNSSDFVRDLIRREQVRREKIANIQAKWTEGIESGIENRAVREIFRDAEGQLMKASHGV